MVDMEALVANDCESAGGPAGPGEGEGRSRASEAPMMV